MHIAFDCSKLEVEIGGQQGRAGGAIGDRNWLHIVRSKVFQVGGDMSGICQRVLQCVSACASSITVPLYYVGHHRYWQCLSVEERRT